jgi:hypothetical protein
VSICIAQLTQLWVYFLQRWRLVRNGRAGRCDPADFADISNSGGYSVGGVGYAVAGGWGNLALSYACFVTAFRPVGSGIANFAGYGTGGYSYYGDISMVATQVTDSDIYAEVAAILPAGYVAWTRIANYGAGLSA